MLPNRIYPYFTVIIRKQLTELMGVHVWHAWYGHRKCASSTSFATISTSLSPRPLSLSLFLSCVRREERDEEIESMAHSTAQYITAQHSTAQNGIVQHGTEQYYTANHTPTLHNAGKMNVPYHIVSTVLTSLYHTLLSSALTHTQSHTHTLPLTFIVSLLHSFTPTHR